MNFDENKILLEVGNKWSYDNTDSFCVINKIENSIIHISIENLSNFKEITSISHVPIDYDFFLKSIIKKIDTIEVSNDYLEGYEIWKKDNGGVWTATIKEILDVILETIN